MKVIVIYTGELLQTWEISRTYCILMMIGSCLVFFQKPAEIQQALRVNMIIYIYIFVYLSGTPPEPTFLAYSSGGSSKGGYLTYTLRVLYIYIYIYSNSVISMLL